MGQPTGGRLKEVKLNNRKEADSKGRLLNGFFDSAFLVESYFSGQCNGYIPKNTIKKSHRGSLWDKILEKMKGKVS